MTLQFSLTKTLLSSPFLNNSHHLFLGRSLPFGRSGFSWFRFLASFLRFGGFSTLRCIGGEASPIVPTTATSERASHATTIPNTKFVNKEFLYA